MKKLFRVLSVLENGFLLLLFLAMVLVAVLQIILRHTVWGGLFWADDFLRVEVLWLAMTGAVIASRHRHHLGLDLSRRFLPAVYQCWVERLVALLTCLLSSALAWYCTQFVKEEQQAATIAFARVPSWCAELVLPIGFALIAVHYACHVFVVVNQDKPV